MIVLVVMLVSLLVFGVGGFRGGCYIQDGIGCCVERFHNQNCNLRFCLLTTSKHTCHLNDDDVSGVLGVWNAIFNRPGVAGAVL